MFKVYLQKGQCDKSILIFKIFQPDDENSDDKKKKNKKRKILGTHFSRPLIFLFIFNLDMYTKNKN